ncbi:putative disease resistance protein RGA3 [Rosa chinensis]|uniref:putative disease resistance protein RGA3 n=1 Tax=Rosa chinensis TaxID=74649 RepID=UPI000D089891|nr:putative disease resistance protein RGA3 [Rosa chinensis]
MWVHVSKDYDVVKIMKSMLECATRKVCKLSHEDVIRNQFEVVLNKKFLLVLDDVWNEAPHDWDDFKLLFRLAHPGSRVIVTTRSTTVSSIVTSNGDILCLDILSHDHCWGIIKHGLRTNVEQRPDLKEIGVKLAEKCKGVPLVAKVIGDYLHIKSDQREWDSLLNCDLLNLAADDNNLYNVLKLSYDHLPADLKRCFTYCSVIPHCQRVKVQDLIQMWAAQGFIQAQGARRIDEIGMEYLLEKLKRNIAAIILYIKSHREQIEKLRQTFY